MLNNDWRAKYRPHPAHDGGEEEGEAAQRVEPQQGDAPPRPQQQEDHQCNGRELEQFADGEGGEEFGAERVGVESKAVVDEGGGEPEVVTDQSLAPQVRVGEQLQEGGRRPCAGRLHQLPCLLVQSARKCAPEKVRVEQDSSQARETARLSLRSASRCCWPPPPCHWPAASGRTRAAAGGPAAAPAAAQRTAAAAQRTALVLTHSQLLTAG